MPIVTGLFTSLDLSSGEPPRVSVQTRPYATSWTARQIVAAIAAVLLLCISIGLLLRSGRRGRHRSWTEKARAIWSARNATDVLVVGVLLVWWIVAPTLFDDGWIALEYQAFGDLGTLNVYLDSWGVTSPFGYWFAWPAHWAIGLTDELVLMRIPALLALLASWFVCRWCLGRIVPLAATSVRWSLAGTFLVGATAWGMTLRPEPLISLLAVAGLAAMVWFANEPRAAPLALAVGASVLAVTLHPVAIVVVAPLLVAAPVAARWLRRDGLDAVVAVATVLVGGLALALLLASLDADLPARLEDARIARTGAFHDEAFWREYVRYERFDQYGAGTHVRHLSLALLLLPVAAWLTRRRSAAAISTLPAAAVGVGLVLLAFSPSKWPWHFGALAGMGAVAAAAELARIREEPRRGQLPSIRQSAALVALVCGLIWSWVGYQRWGNFDLQALTWHSGFGADSFFVLLAVLGGAGFVVLSVARKPPGDVVAWTTTIISVTVVGLTIAVLIRDATISPWSPARQNLEALGGRSSCGPRGPASSRPDSPQRSPAARKLPFWLTRLLRPLPPLRGQARA